MKKAFTILILVFTIGAVSAQSNSSDTAWKVNGDVSLMFSQTSFSNWAAGGENSLNLTGFFNLYAGYEKGKSKWENLLALAYGQTKTGDLEFRKNEDKIDFLSTYGLKASEKWLYSANFSFKSQFAEGYDYHDGDTLGKEKISNLLAPAYITLGLGMEYRPAEYMSLYMSPLTARWIVVNDQELADAGSFGVDPAEYDNTGMKIKDGQTLRQEFGANVRFIFSKEILKNVAFSTKLELYSNYLENPENIDVNWDNTLDLKVNEFINAKFGFQLVYDDNTNVTDKDGNYGPRVQTKQLLSVGLTYKFGQ
ncbi:MAG: DUF3078 domain-containing protein [Bacteroidales bacterium]